MLRRLTLRTVDAAERDLGVSMDYLRHIARTSLGAFAKFGLFIPLSRHRKALPPAPYHLARIAAVQHEDCGTCVQIEVNLALDAGVAPGLVRAAVEGRIGDLPEGPADAVRFAQTVAAAGDDDALRDALRARYGDEGLVELALGIAACRVFPTTKRALGYARACALVPVRYERA